MAFKESKITKELLDELFIINIGSGIFYWKKRISIRCVIDKIAGTNSNGYKRIGIYGYYYGRSRLLWFYVYGYWPIQIDHINLNRSDDRLQNLREVTNQQNQFNRLPYLNKSSKYKGVCWHKKANKWMAYIQKNGKSRHLGLFGKETLAAEAYNLAAKQLFGIYSYLNIIGVK
jgi:hypothetical protein